MTPAAREQAVAEPGAAEAALPKRKTSLSLLREARTRAGEQVIEISGAAPPLRGRWLAAFRRAEQSPRTLPQASVKLAAGRQAVAKPGAAGAAQPSAVRAVATASPEVGAEPAELAKTSSGAVEEGPAATSAPDGEASPGFRRRRKSSSPLGAALPMPPLPGKASAMMNCVGLEARTACSQEKQLHT